MKRAPERFTSRLDSLFDHRLRIRWSVKRDEWHIEYKVAPGQILTKPISENDDRMIRARDGYALILAVREGDRMPCPRCGYELKVPAFEVQEVNCDYCKMLGKDGRYPACYFPLDGDALLTYLSKLDPLKGWRNELAKVADAQNARLLRQHERKLENTIEATTKENIRQLFGIAGTGYTGKEFR